MTTTYVPGKPSGGMKSTFSLALDQKLHMKFRTMKVYMLTRKVTKGFGEREMYFVTTDQERGDDRC